MEREHLVQRRVFALSEEFERRREASGRVTKEDLTVYYIKEALRDSMKGSSFQVTVGVGRVLHSYRTREVMNMYGTVAPNRSAKKNDDQCRGWKMELMYYLQNRFGRYLSTATGPHGEKRFVTAKDSGVLALARRCLGWFTPSCTCNVISDKCDQIAPHALNYVGPPDKEHATELLRFHAVICPACFLNLTKAWRLDAPIRRLSVPDFDPPPQNADDDYSDRNTPPDLSDSVIDGMLDEIAAERERRRKMSPLTLRVMIDGVEDSELDLNASKTCLKVSRGQEVIKLLSAETGEVLVTHLMTYGDEDFPSATVSEYRVGDFIISFTDGTHDLQRFLDIRRAVESPAHGIGTICDLGGGTIDVNLELDREQALYDTQAARQGDIYSDFRHAADSHNINPEPVPHNNEVEEPHPLGIRALYGRCVKAILAALANRGPGQQSPFLLHSEPGCGKSFFVTRQLMRALGQRRVQAPGTIPASTASPTNGRIVPISVMRDTVEAIDALTARQDRLFRDYFTLAEDFKVAAAIVAPEAIEWIERLSRICLWVGSALSASIIVAVLLHLVNSTSAFELLSLIVGAASAGWHYFTWSSRLSSRYTSTRERLEALQHALWGGLDPIRYWRAVFRRTSKLAVLVGPNRETEVLGLGSVLRDRGFRIVLIDPAVANLHAEIISKLDSASGQQTFMVYFAGHGNYVDRWPTRLWGAENLSEARESSWFQGGLLYSACLDECKIHRSEMPVLVIGSTFGGTGSGGLWSAFSLAAVHWLGASEREALDDFQRHACNLALVEAFRGYAAGRDGFMTSSDLATYINERLHVSKISRHGGKVQVHSNDERSQDILLGSMPARASPGGKKKNKKKSDPRDPALPWEL